MHCHTIACSHAYSTIGEYAQCAAQKGLQAFAVTDHAPGVTDGVHLYHFQNMKVIPREICGVTVLRGVECTFQDGDASLDLDDKTLEHLDIVIASMHQSKYAPSNSDEHTMLLLRAMDNPHVDILGHIGRERMEFDIESVVKKAKETKTLIEINSSSFAFGKHIKKRCFEIVTACKKYSLPLVVNSDSHICYNVGNFECSMQLLREAGYDSDLIVNSTLDKVLEYLNIIL